MTSTSYSTDRGGSANAPVALAYNGTEIHFRRDMMALTDMWKSAGSDPQKTPAKWRDLPSTKAFVDHVELIVGKSDIFKSSRGRTGGTYAHWQIGLAYAKYLSPQFHVWCNTVVRERMEGKPQSGTGLVTALDPDVCNAIGGIVKRVMRANLPEMVEEAVERMLEADPIRQRMDFVSVRQLLNDAKALQKGRNSLNRRVGYTLRKRALLQGSYDLVRKCPHSGVWLYKYPFAKAYMAESGLQLVKEHNDRVSGQGRLKLVRSSAPASNGEARQ